MDKKTEDLIAKHRGAMTTAAALTFTRSLVLIYGTPGSGKTTLFLTASKHFKGFRTQEDIQKGGLIFCSDLCLIQVDPGGSDGFKSMGYDCHVVDYRKILDEVPDPDKAMSISISLAKELQGVEFWGLDTVSQLNDDKIAYLAANEQLYTSEGGNVNTMAMWILLIEMHKAVYREFMDLSGVKFALAHAKVLTDDILLGGDLKTQRQKTEKALMDRKDKVSMPGNPSITIDITGKSKDIWQRLNSLQIFIRVVEPTPGKPLVRELNTEYSGVVDASVKSRFSFLLGGKPEFHLGRIIEKIRA